MSFLKNRFDNFRSDKILYISAIISVILAGLHLFQYHDSNYNVEPLIRFILCCLYPFIVFLAGRNGLFWFYFGYGNLLALDTTFQNYTAFFILVIFVMFKPKYKLMTLLMYIADIIFIASFRHKTPSHLIIHALNCFCFYFVISKSFTLIPHKKLNLLPDEIRILNELASGKNQNEIEFFSPNTVCSKMKKARIRNGFNTNDELILFFIKENSIEEIK